MAAPTCPWCGNTGRVSLAGRPEGRWFCACGSLFHGTDSEWRRLAAHRRRAAERRARPAQHIPSSSNRRTPV